MKVVLRLSESIPLKKWELNLNATIDWNQAFFNIYVTTKINKLREFQYKCNFRLCTSKYMRKIMRIEKDSDQCHACSNFVETLDHQLTACVATVRFREKLEQSIRTEETDYTDEDSTFISCTHTNKAVNYLNLVAKYYINLKFRKQKLLWWEEYTWYAKNFLDIDKVEEDTLSKIHRIIGGGQLALRA